MTTIKKQTVSGVKWLVGSSTLTKFISLLTTVVLARILSPSIFGLYSLAFIAIDALGLFKSLGIDAALIRKKDFTQKAANTAFFIIPLSGVLLYLILSFSAPTISKFLHNQELVYIIRALGIVFIISCFGRVPAAILEKNMQFKKITIADVSSTIIYTVSAVIFSLLKFGIWSLVIAYILRTINQNILIWIFSEWHPQFEFDWKIALEMLNFGKFIFIGSAVWFLKMNLDNLLVGRILGTAALGLYGIAFNIANFSADYFGGRVSRVVFPAYSKLQDNLYDLRSATLKTLKYISLIAIPVGIGIFFLSGELLSFVYGKKWIDATNVLKILAWAGIFNTLPAGMSSVFLACGKPRLGLWIVILQVSIFFAFITPMANLFGINGVGAVVSLSSFLACILIFFWAMKLLSMDFRQIYDSLRPALVSSLCMAAGIMLLKNIPWQNNFAVLKNYNFPILAVIGFAIYISILSITEKEFFEDTKKLIFR